MLVSQVIMVITLMTYDGTVTKGVIPYDSYESCYASLKHQVNTKVYQWSDRVCMNDVPVKTFVKYGGPKSGWKD